MSRELILLDALLFDTKMKLGMISCEAQKTIC